MSETKEQSIRMTRVILGLIAERMRQLQKWGPQTHPDGTGRDWTAEASLSPEQRLNFLRALERVVKERTDKAAADGTLTWEHILAEEFWEALATDNSADLRKELTQVAAVAMAWIEDLDAKAGVIPQMPPDGEQS